MTGKCGEMLDVLHTTWHMLHTGGEVRWKGSDTRIVSDCAFMWCGKIVVNSEGIKAILKEYMEKLLNEGNILNQNVDSDAKEGSICVIAKEELSQSNHTSGAWHENV